MFLRIFLYLFIALFVPPIFVFFAQITGNPDSAIYSGIYDPLTLYAEANIYWILICLLFGLPVLWVLMLIEFFK